MEGWRSCRAITGGFTIMETICTSSLPISEV
jgi:hypothetical protein